MIVLCIQILPSFHSFLHNRLQRFTWTYQDYPFLLSFQNISYERCVWVTINVFHLRTWCDVKKCQVAMYQIKENTSLKTFIKEEIPKWV